MIQVCQRQAEKFVLVLPHLLASSEFVRVTGSGRWICDLGDQVGCRGLGYTVYKDSHQGNLDKPVEAEAEAE